MKTKFILISLLASLFSVPSFANNEDDFYEKNCTRIFSKQKEVSSKEAFVKQCVTNFKQKNQSHVIYKKITEEEFKAYEKGCVEFTEKTHAQNKKLKKNELYLQCLNKQLELLAKQNPKPPKPKPIYTNDVNKNNPPGPEKIHDTSKPTTTKRVPSIQKSPSKEVKDNVTQNIK